MTDALQTLARAEYARLVQPDKKQVRFNDIVRVAERFYPTRPDLGVIELVQSCDKTCVSLYVAGDPMWQRLEQHYGWMSPIA